MIDEFYIENDNVFYSDSEEENLIFEESELKISFFNRIKNVWSKIKTPLTKIALHINVHLNFLSLLEPTFYFLYASNLEKKILISKINDLFFMLINYVKVYITHNPDTKNYIKKQVLIYKNKYDKESYLSKQEKNNFNKNLIIQSFIPFYITSVLLVGLILLAKKYTKINIKNIYLEHLILMFFIGIYEYWIFKNIIINYKAITDTEIKSRLLDELYNNL